MYKWYSLVSIHTKDSFAMRHTRMWVRTLCTDVGIRVCVNT